MPCVSTQTTTFLPAFVPVLKSQRLPKRFLARMMRKHFKEVKQTNTIRAKLQREVAANKKALLKILKDMTLTVRKNKADAKKALKEANKAAKESAKTLKEADKALKEADKALKEADKKAKQKAKEQKLFDAAVNQFSKELKAAAKKEEETEMKEQKKFDKAARKFAADQKKLDHISMVARMRAESAVQNYAAAQVITNNTNDSVFIPFLGLVTA